MSDLFHGETDEEYKIDGYDRINYNLCICQCKNGKYIIYADIEGLKGFIFNLHFATFNIHSYGEGDMISHEYKNVQCSGYILRGLIFSIIGRKYSKSPSKNSYERVHNRRIELYLTVKEAKQLLERVLIYYRKIVTKRNVGPVELFPGLTLEYVTNGI